VTLRDHPSILRFQARAQPSRVGPPAVEAEELMALGLTCGADDAGAISIDHPDIADQRAEILAFFPAARTLLALVCKMNREPIRSPARSVANLEFHGTGDRVNEVAHRVVASLESRGVRAVNPAMGFPMEMDRWPGRTWLISHKPVAIAAGLGQMGIHRNVIHPRFGSFILLGTVVLDATIERECRPIDYNPCLECKLCVAACPVGAIDADGGFNFAVCYTHNYREFMGGFVDWVEGIAESESARDYRRRTSDAETASMWQSLSFGANYKAAYCIAVCPAGDDVLGPFVTDRKSHIDTVVRPFQEKPETIYALSGTDVAQHVARRFPAKRTKTMRSGLHVRDAADFLRTLHLLFQKGRAKGLSAVYHFIFTGEAPCEATIEIRDQTLRVTPGLEGRPDLRLTADGPTWLSFLRHETSLANALLHRRIRLKGSPRLLIAFGRCFPS
jgi:Fe-S-cluster-containing hydrogenase component 2